MDVLVLIEVASAMLALGMAAVLAVYYWLWWRSSPTAAAEVGAVTPWVISAFSLWIGLKTLVPMITTLVAREHRGWRAPLDTVANLVIVALLYVVCRSVAERREHDRQGR